MIGRAGRRVGAHRGSAVWPSARADCALSRRPRQEWRRRPSRRLPADARTSGRCREPPPPAGAVGKEALDDAVLERMERHDGQTPARLEHTLGGKQRPRQFAEFVIDEDAQRLKDPGRRMDLVLRVAADQRLDRFGQVARAREGRRSRRASRSSARCAPHAVPRRESRRCAQDRQP